MDFFYKLLIRVFFAVAVLGCCRDVNAQGLLNKTVSIKASNQPLGEVLKLVGQQGGFYFSYNSDLIPAGKAVTLSAEHKTVRQVLDALLDNKYQYKERDNYIIIQDGEGYTVSGYVVDKTTGSKISYASVYEKQQLASTITNEQGYFKLKLKDKDKYPVANISVSKGMYADTFMTLKPGFDQVLTVSITPKDYELEPVVVKPQVERNWLAGIFLSSKQRFQAMNIGGYIASRPVQTSFVPGLGTHGRLGAQVVNKFSLNVLGGYTAGAKGVEIGGLFNIDKGDVGYAQAAGLFNVVGGGVSGVQVAGLYNGALDSVEGVQISGLSGMTKGRMKGVQVSGLYSQVAGKTKGAQISGLVNVAAGEMTGVQIAGWGSVSVSEIEGTQIGGLFNYAKKISGTQIAGLGNISSGETDGVQISGIYNYSKNLKGTQFGLININDSSSGYSIGLVNLVMKNGYHKLCISTNEVLNTNIALKTGTRKLYSILTAGTNISTDKKAYGLFYGLGKEIHLSKLLALSTEATAGILYVGDWEQTPTLLCLAPELHVKLNKYISLHAGPSFSLFYQNAKTPIEGYSTGMPAYAGYAIGNMAGWFGWHAGIDFF